MISRRAVLHGCLPLAFGAGCGPAAPPPPITPPGEKHFLRKPMLELEVERRVLEDPASKRKDLQFFVHLQSKEQLMQLQDLRMMVMILGRHRADPKRPDTNGKWRMILNTTKSFGLLPGQTYAFESDVIESGEKDPWHLNYGVAYQGYLVRVENKYGELAIEKTSDSRLPLLAPKWKDISSGQDFQP
jgi:hypothetical protein